MNAVVPGMIYTLLIEGLVNHEEERWRRVGESIVENGNKVPMGHMRDARDVAEAACWLCSGASRYVTGQCLVVDGGATSTHVGSEGLM